MDWPRGRTRIDSHVTDERPMRSTDMSTTSNASRARLALAAVFATFVAAPLAAPPHAASSMGTPTGKALFGRAWVAKAIVKDGERIRLEPGTRLVLRLRHGRHGDFATWRAGCNHFDAQVDVDPERLRLHEIVQTQMGCKRALLRQDNRIARFLASNPRWKRKGRRLILRSGDDAIRLKRRRPATVRPA